MKFFELLETLKTEYKDNCVVRKNGTLVLAPGKIPRARHMLYAPLPEGVIDEFLVRPFAHKFPQEYIQFLRYSNGANLYWVQMVTKEYSFAKSVLTILGLPITPPYARPIDEEEPFDMRVEDCNRHEKLPEHLLKCAIFVLDIPKDVRVDIFVDLYTNSVCGYYSKTTDLYKEWNSMDECFCELFEQLKDCKEAYERG